MSEPLFRVGGVYRDGKARAIKLIPCEPPTLGWAIAAVADERGDFSDNVWGGDGGRRLSDGRYVHDRSNTRDDIALVPGELHQVDGQWVPISEQPMAPYFAEALEEEDPLDAENVHRYLAAHGIPAYNVRVQRIPAHNPNAAMIARDGPAKPVPASIPEAHAATAKPALARLVVLGAVDHRLGSAYR